MGHMAFPGRDFMYCAHIVFFIGPIRFVQAPPNAYVLYTFPNITPMARTKQTARAATVAGKAPRQTLARKAARKFGPVVQAYKGPAISLTGTTTWWENGAHKEYDVKIYRGVRVFVDPKDANTKDPQGPRNQHFPLLVVEYPEDGSFWWGLLTWLPPDEGASEAEQDQLGIIHWTDSGEPTLVKLELDGPLPENYFALEAFHRSFGYKEQVAKSSPVVDGQEATQVWEEDGAEVTFPSKVSREVTIKVPVSRKKTEVNEWSAHFNQDKVGIITGAPSFKAFKYSTYKYPEQLWWMVFVPSQELGVTFGTVGFKEARNGGFQYIGDVTPTQHPALATGLAAQPLCEVAEAAPPMGQWSGEAGPSNRVAAAVVTPTPRSPYPVATRTPPPLTTPRTPSEGSTSPDDIISEGPATPAKGAARKRSREGSFK